MLCRPLLPSCQELSDVITQVFTFLTVSLELREIDRNPAHCVCVCVCVCVCCVGERESVCVCRAGKGCVCVCVSVVGKSVCVCTCVCAREGRERKCVCVCASGGGNVWVCACVHGGEMGVRIQCVCMHSGRGVGVCGENGCVGMVGKQCMSVECVFMHVWGREKVCVCMCVQWGHVCV